MNKHKIKYLRLITLIGLIIIIILLLTRCSRKDIIITNTEDYINKKNITIEDTYNLKLTEMMNYGYTFNVKEDCLKYSYVNITNVNGKLKYKFNLVCSTSELTLNLVGNKDIELEYESEYIETGAAAFYNNEDISSKIKIDSSNLNLSKLGTYKIVYKTDIDGVHKEIERTIKVVDTIKPTISLKGNTNITLPIGSKYIDEGYIAFDNYDKDITSKVSVSGSVNTKKTGIYIIKYEVTDSSLNKTSVERVIEVKNTTQPVINLNGLSTHYLEYPSNYIEPGFTAYDSTDGDITNKVILSGSVDTKKIGTYKLTYTVKNSAGKSFSTTRIIIVKDNIKPTITLYGDSYSTLEYKSNYIEQGAYAFDNYDSDITNKIVQFGFIDTNILGKQYITYKVTDTSGNTTTLQRTVEIKDTTKPTINIDDNSKNVYIEKSDDYNILGGVTALDNYDGDITNKITYTSNPTYNNNKIGEYTITYTVKDINGNTSDAVSKNITVEDTIIPTLDITYSTKSLTNKKVRVTIVSNEFITINDSSWVCYEYTCYKDYNQNINEEIEVLDLASNKNSASIIIDNIDTTKPIGSVINNPSTFTNTDVEVTITTDKDILPIEGWTKVNNTTFKKTYTDNSIEDITITDKYGNDNTVNVVVDNINRILPNGTLSYNIQNTNQDILVTLVIDKEVLNINGWDTTDNKTFTKIYSQNVNEVINFVDKYGNSGSVNLNITNIDKNKPILNTSYSPNLSIMTKDDVIVTVTSNKEVTSNTSGFVCSNKTCTKTYSTNTNEVLTVTDLYGNTESISVGVTNIDKLKPVVNIGYSKTTPTNTDVVVTITGNEDITINDYNCITNICTKTYSENMSETLTIYDKVLNSNTLNVNINWIDKTPPVITLNGEQTINLDPKTSYSDPGVTVVDNMDNNVNIFTSGVVDVNNIGEYILTYTATDAAGNKSQVSRKVIINSTLYDNYYNEMKAVEELILNINDNADNRIGTKLDSATAANIRGINYYKQWYYVTADEILALNPDMDVTHAPYIVRYTLTSGAVLSIPGEIVSGSPIHTFNYNGDPEELSLYKTGLLSAVTNDSTKSGIKFGELDIISNGTYDSKDGFILGNNYATLPIDQTRPVNEVYSISVTVKGPIPQTPKELNPNTIVAISETAGQYLSWIGIYNKYLHIYSFYPTPKGAINKEQYSVSDPGFISIDLTKIKLNCTSEQVDRGICDINNQRTVDFNNEYLYLHVSAKRNGETKIYINGILYKTILSGSSILNYGNATIGDLRPNRGLKYTGSIYNFALYSEVLDQAAVTQNWDYFKTELRITE